MLNDHIKSKHLIGTVMTKDFNFAEDYRKAAEHHARNNNFAAAHFYTNLYLMYAPPPESDLDVPVSVEET